MSDTKVMISLNGVTLRDEEAHRKIDQVEKNIAAAVEAALSEAKESGEFDGEDGEDGKDGTNGVGIASVTQTTTSTADGGENVITVTKTDGTASTFKVRNGSKGSTGAKGDKGDKGDTGNPGAQGEKGEKGDDGASPVINITEHSVTDGGGVTITVTNPDGSTSGGRVYDGQDGEDGRGIASVRRTAGTGAAGTTDTYTITYSDGTRSTFTVYNGADGSSSGLTDADKQAIAEAAAEMVGTLNVDDTLKISGAAADAAKVGTELDALSKTINDFVEGETTTTLGDIHTEIVYKKLIDSTGVVADYTTNNYHVTDFVSVGDKGKVYITGSSHYRNYIYAFYDEDKTFLSGMQTEGIADIQEIVDYEVTVPENAKYIVAGGCYLSDYTAAVKYPSARIKKLQWTGKKWACVGDSLTEKNIRATKNYHDYIAEATGIEVVNLGLSGSGYAKEGLGAPFYQRITDVPLDCDVITIFGSGNDRTAGLEIGSPTDTGTDTICGCINTTLDNLFAHKLDAKVGLITPTPWNTNDVQGNLADDQNSWGVYCAAIVEIARIRGIPCLDLYHCSGLRPWDAAFRAAFFSREDDSGTGCHPDENGHAFIAPMFKAFLEKLIL